MSLFSFFYRNAAHRQVNHFGEELVYYSRDGKVRKIKGHVRRNSLDIIAETGEIPSQELVITVKNSDCDGISSSEIDTGGDEIEVALRVGLTPQRRSIARILSDHNDCVRFLCQ